MCWHVTLACGVRGLRLSLSFDAYLYKKLKRKNAELISHEPSSPAPRPMMSMRRLYLGKGPFFGPRSWEQESLERLRRKRREKLGRQRLARSRRDRWVEAQISRRGPPDS